MNIVQKVWGSLYCRILVTSVLITLLVGSLVTFFSLAQLAGARHRVDCYYVVKVAQTISEDLKNTVPQPATWEALEQRIQTYAAMRPQDQIFLLDKSGRIRGASRSRFPILQEQVSLERIRSFIVMDKSQPRFVDISDPREPERRRGFSAAPIRLPNVWGYVLVTVGGPDFSLKAERPASDIILVRVIFVNLFLALVASLIFGVAFFYLLTKRFRQLVSAVKRFEQGDHEQRIEYEAYDQIGTLGRAFNKMAKTISANLDQLEKKDRLRRRLVENISHDLRTPLTSMQGFLDVILIDHHESLDQETTRFLTIIQDEVSMISTLVNELFELSKYEAHECKPKIEPFSASALAEDLTQRFRGRAKQKHVQLTLDADETLPYVSADSTMIERVLNNLLDNALAHTPPRGQISVRLQQDADRISFEIQDTGVGIPSKHIPRLFDRFYRLDEARTSGKGGTGLGLTIVKRILDLHQTEICVDSEPGEGSCFSFTLPIHHFESAQSQAEA